jgi:adenylate cyclase
VSQPSSGSVALRAELVDSIRTTLLAEARRTEAAMATVRVLALVGFAAVEVRLLTTPTLLGDAIYPASAVTFSYLLASVGLWWWLSRGGYSPWLSYLLPPLDGAVAAARLSFVFGLGAAQVARTQEMATITGLACLLALSGAFRLQGAAVGWSTGIGLLFYGGFAGWIGLPLFHASVHFVLVAACGAAGAQLTTVVSRAVQHEVTRLTLRRLLPTTVVDAADADPLALLTEPRSLDATVLVTDIRGFTTWAERRSPLEVLSRLNEVQGVLAAAVLAEGGTVDKFMGDGMLAVFGAPQAQPDHADRALRTVDRILAAMRRFPDLTLGIGVHSGELVVGCLGSGIRLEFTVLGDTVNTASRLESATKELPVNVLVSEATRARATRQLSPLAPITLRGRAEPVTVWTMPPA